MPERIISAQPSRVPSRDEVGADELALDRHHVAHQPDVEAQIVGEAAQQRHRHVRVRVDQARHDDAAAAVDASRRRRRRAPRARPRRSSRPRSPRAPPRWTVNRSSIVRTVRVGQQEVAASMSLRIAATFTAKSFNRRRDRRVRRKSPCCDGAPPAAGVRCAQDHKRKPLLSLAACVCGSWAHLPREARRRQAPSRDIRTSFSPSPVAFDGRLCPKSLSLTRGSIAAPQRPRTRSA